MTSHGMTSQGPNPAAAWESFVDGLRRAGEALDARTAELDPAQRADAYRALVRGLANQLGRFEVDRERPELVEFNTWRQKMLMDNPDFRYWVADIRDDRSYHVTGSAGDAVYQSVTAYSRAASPGSSGLDAAAAARLDSDSIHLDDRGRFEITVARHRPEDGSDWLELPDGATALWVRQFHDTERSPRTGRPDPEPAWCSIEPLDVPEPPPSIDPARFDRRLARLGAEMGAFPKIWAAATAEDLANPNQVRHWSEMAGGAAFTEAGIHYLRGAWQLDPDEALVIEGPVPQCRYWNVLLYSRFLNSLDHRHRRVSLTGGAAQVVDGSYRLLLAAADPGGAGDWLDTEGRPFGLFVFRFLQPHTEPHLPTVRRCRLDELAGGR